MKTQKARREDPVGKRLALEGVERGSYRVVLPPIISLVRFIEERLLGDPQSKQNRECCGTDCCHVCDERHISLSLVSRLSNDIYNDGYS